MALTDKEILALKPTARKYKVFDGDGLFIVVHPKGGRYWYMKYHIDGRPHEVAFGTYPAVTLKLAREKRDEARQQLARGLNPKLEKKATKAARAVLFEDVAEEWVQMMSRPVSDGGEVDFKADGATRAALDPATIKKHRWLLDTYLVSALGKWPMAQIAAQQLLPVLKRIEQEGKSETAHRVRSLASRIFCYAHSTGRAPQGDITMTMRDALAPVVTTHHASITDPEKVGELLLAIDSYRCRIASHNFVTGCLTSDVTGGRLLPFSGRF